MTAEQLAPFLDITRDQLPDRAALTPNESLVVPVLARFGGTPEVDREGNLLYRFPSLQVTGSAQVRVTASSFSA